jgi:predicted enzyme related to lactoylglutathione lyase
MRTSPHSARSSPSFEARFISSPQASSLADEQQVAEADADRDPHLVLDRQRLVRRAHVALDVPGGVDGAVGRVEHGEQVVGLAAQDPPMPLLDAGPDQSLHALEEREEVHDPLAANGPREPARVEHEDRRRPPEPPVDLGEDRVAAVRMLVVVLQQGLELVAPGHGRLGARFRQWPGVVGRHAADSPASTGWVAFERCPRALRVRSAPVSVELRNVVFECRDLERLSAFWQAALGWPERVVRDREAIVAPAGWGFPRIAFRLVEGPKERKNRVHLDLTADDMEAEVRRLEGLGAKRGPTMTEGLLLTAMRDPEGNEFCVAHRSDTGD